MCHLLSKKRRAVEITVSIANYTKGRAVRYEYAKKGMTGKDIITVEFSPPSTLTSSTLLLCFTAVSPHLRVPLPNDVCQGVKDRSGDPD